MSASRSGSACRRLKLDIYNIALPDTETPLDRRFFPTTKLRQLLTTARIQNVLQCSCSACTDRVGSGTRLDFIESSHMITSCALLVFSLLVYLDCPQLVHSFLRLGYHDEHLRNSSEALDESSIPDKFWPDYHQRDPSDSAQLATRFRWSRYQFFVPIICHDYTIYDKTTILPFFNEKPLGRKCDNGDIIQEGAFGRVYSFQIVDEYRDLPVRSSNVTSLRYN